MNHAIKLMLIITLPLVLFSCAKEQNGDVSGEACALKGKIVFVDNYGGYKIKVDNSDEFVQPLVSSSVHCPVFDEMFVEEGMRVQFSYRDLNHTIEGDASAGVPSAKAVTLMCLSPEGEPIPEHTHH